VLLPVVLGGRGGGGERSSRDTMRCNMSSAIQVQIIVLLLLFLRRAAAEEVEIDVMAEAACSLLLFEGAVCDMDRERRITVASICGEECRILLLPLVTQR
jgi:hypothetical protein